MNVQHARSAAGLVAIAASLFVSSAEAAGEAPSPPAAASGATPSVTSAIVSLAESVKTVVGTSRSGALLVVAPVKSDVPLVRADELALRIAQVTGGKIAARVHEKPATASAARALAGRASELVFVQPEIEKGELRLVIDAYPVVVNGWERLKNPLPGPRAHGFAKAPLDAEVRAFMPPILIEQAKTARAKHTETDVLAVACGDVDGDGSQEIVLLSRSRVALGRLTDGSFVIEKSAKLRDLGTRAPAPLREPLGTALVATDAPHGSLLVGTSDRGGLSLGPDLTPRHQLAGLPLSVEGGGQCLTLDAEHGGFDALVPCASHSARVTSATLGLPARFDAASRLRYVDATGAAHESVAFREPPNKVRVRVDGVDVFSQDGVGAQVLLADLDLDGVPEVITTADTGDDRIVVTSLGKGSAKPRLRLEAKDGVRALGLCPPERGAIPALVASVGNEVWLVR